MRKHRKILLLLLIVLFLTGLFLCLYPTVNKLRVASKLQQASQDFYTVIADTASSTPQNTTEDNTVTEEEPLYPELFEAIRNYNRQLYLEGQQAIDSPLAFERSSFCLGDYGLDTEIFAVLSISRLELSMPVYLGATSEHLSAGAALMGQTSIPIGDSNTNAVIAGHRGWRGADFFLEVDELAPGDAVFITNLWEKLEYRVVEVKIIAPNDVEAIKIQSGRELVTLLTCHPPATGGRQRYLVICERVTNNT